jgi:glycosyltransferase involved in cell wall biosynthesis
MKLLIVRSTQLSSWGSCKVISPNLQSTYEGLKENFEINWFDIPANYIEKEIDSTSDSIHDLAEAIRIQKPDQLVFIDHLPCPANILSRLCQVLEPRQLPAIVIHVYGDFTYFSKDWLDVSLKLHKHPVKFIAASSSQKKLIEFFCDEPDTVEQFCFPVNSAEYFFDEIARKELRKKHNIEDQDIILLYTGRVSLQKNVDMLLQEYLELLKHETVSVHLWIVGAIDDMGAPFMGLKTTDGYLFSKLQSMISHHPNGYTKNIKFWGLQDKNELRKLKSAADLFVSLSLYHDEDYGMSPAEAMSCGLPSLLTDWGGYSSFASTKWRCKLAPVKITEFGLQIKMSALKEFIEEQKQSYITAADRSRWAKAFHDEFSIEKNTTKLSAILKKPSRKFTGFKWTLAPFSQMYGKENLTSTIDPHSCPSDKNFYYEVYKNYISLNDTSNDFFKVVQWAYDYIQNSSQESGMPVGRKVRANHFYLKPFSLDYYSHANPVLLGGYITKKLTDKKIWMIRDGLIPTTFFFREHLPETTSGVIAIHHDLWPIVPEHWREHVVYYKTQCDQYYDSQNMPERILIAGMSNSTFADEKEFIAEIESLKSKIENLKSIPTTVLLPGKKNNLWGRTLEESDYARSKELFTFLNPDVKFADWNDLKNESQFNNCLYHEINKGYFIKDSYVQYFALSRGAGLLRPEKESLRLTEIASHSVSLFHSVKLYNLDYTNLPAYQDPFKSPEFDYYSDLVRGQVKSVRITSSWESWYPMFLKKFYKAYGKTNL